MLRIFYTTLLGELCFLSLTNTGYNHFASMLRNPSVILQFPDAHQTLHNLKVRGKELVKSNRQIKYLNTNKSALTLIIVLALNAGGVSKVK
jgi:hypothetical protein